MCILIDANRTGDLVKSPPGPAARLVLDYVGNSGGKIVVGGKLEKELVHNHNLLKLFVEWKRAQRLVQIKAEVIESRVEELARARLHQSNDLHVLALALASGARVLWTDDRALQDDFRNKSLIDNPRGRVFSGPKSKGLLTRKTCEKACK